MAYYRAAERFFAWCDHHKIGEIADIEPLHVAAYVEGLGKDFEKPTVKQHLAAIRMLFDWLVVGQVVATNPAHSVRGPKHVVKTGKTTVLTGEQARELLDSINTSTVVGLRDRALISVMTFAFARIGAAVAMRVEDYYPKGKRWWVRLHEKGGKRHEMPAHHNLEAYLDAYIKAAGIGTRPRAPVPLRRRPHRHANRQGNEPHRCLAHGSAPRGGSRHAGPHWLPHISSDRNHRVSRSRRDLGKRASHGGARKPAYDQAVRSDGG
jgi:site-specific recombinase XerC